MTYEVVLFDLDHTLLDSDRSEALAFDRTLRAAGIEEPRAHFATYDTINKGLWAAVERGEVTPDVVKGRRFELLVEAIEVDADPATMAAAFVTGLGEFGELFEGAMELLASVDRHATLGLVTNGLGEVQRRRIDRLGLGPFFAGIAISAELGVAKPQPEIFDAVMAALPNVPKDHVVMIGDSLSSDIAGGANFGIDTIWYNPHGRPVPASGAQPTFEIGRLGAVVDIVAGNGTSL